MYKKIILVIGIAFLLLVIIMNYTSAQDSYHDGNYSNGEKISFPDGEYIFVEGEIDQIELETNEESQIYTIELRNVGKSKIKTTLLKTEIDINREVKTPLIVVKYFKGKLLKKNPIEIISLENEKQLVSIIYIEYPNMFISINGGLKIYHKTALFESNYFREGIYSIKINNESEITTIILDELRFDELDQIQLKAKLGKDSIVKLPLECPPVWLNKGGLFEISKNLFIFSPREFISVGDGFYFFKFIPEEKVIFKAVENLDKFEGGCITEISSKESVSKNYIKNMKGKFFSFSTGDLKIIDGEIEIDGSRIKGQNFYFFTFLSDFKNFNENEELKKNNGALFFDPELKALVLSDNANLKITANGQEINFKDGKLIEVVPNFFEIYRLQGKREEEVLSLPPERWLQNDANCADFGGEWQISCVNAWIGKEKNIWSGAKILDYVPGKICCAKQILKTIDVREIEVGDKYIEVVQIDEKTVGRNIFLAPEGSIVVDIAPMFLKNDIDKIKKEIFDKKIIKQIPSEIKTTDLKKDKRNYIGAYYPSINGGIPEIEITRKGLDSSVITHEILHHFFRLEGKREKVQAAMSKYITDEKLNDKEKKTRDRLLNYLENWKDYYRPTTEKEYFELIICDEGHSVIGQWLDEENRGLLLDIKFPDYILELYEGILKSEIIAQGR